MVDAGKFKCTSCGYCMPCPEDINIPEIFKLWNQINVLGRQAAAGALENIAGKIKDCTKCGSCEKKCPNRLEIIKMLELI